MKQKQARRKFVTNLLLTSGSVSLAASVHAVNADESQSDAPKVVLRGRVFCLTEELEKRYGLKSDCENRSHVYSLKTADEKYYPFLPTDMAAAIFLDQRIRERELQITARMFPATSFIEIIKLQSIKLFRVYDLYYFCDVCNIRTHKPGPCDCCQEPVVLREEPEADPSGLTLKEP